ncbi:hypothetical protein [Pedobacter kyungheensis]|uniref:hypothetical protein n=1 Tax=Pedobacter kyungheensis TaxID=1069985 RepID=UPI0012E082DE|nr:hypothetical protein [Pedobacter kyungheensis]
MKLIFIAYVFILLTFVGKANNKQISVNRMIEKKWVLESKFSSPWKVTLLPTFLDFEKKQNFALTRNIGNKSESVHPYVITNEELKIGKNLILKIIELTENKLLIELDGIQYTYYPIFHVSAILDANKFIKNFKDKKWSYGESELLFTNKEEMAMNGVIGREMIEFIGGKKYFGTYYVDHYDNNLFCVFLIDGKFPTLYYIKQFDESKIVLISPSSMQLLLLAE